MNIKNDISEVEKRIYKNILTSKNGNNNHKFTRKITIKKRDKAIATVISIVLLCFAIASTYYFNLFIKLTYNIEANLAQIDTQVQKRKNLIINLGTTVIDYSKHERELFTYLGQLRTTLNSRSPEQTMQALKANDNRGTQNQNSAAMSQNLENWDKTLSQLMAIAEQYPDLKLSENFQKYMDAILEFENKIADLRMNYNTTVNEYSTTKDQFPGKVFAAMFKFGDFQYFKLDQDENKFVKVKY